MKALRLVEQDVGTLQAKAGSSTSGRERQGTDQVHPYTQPTPTAEETRVPQLADAGLNLEGGHLQVPWLQGRAQRRSVPFANAGATHQGEVLSHDLLHRLPVQAVEEAGGGEAEESKEARTWLDQ